MAYFYEFELILAGIILLSVMGFCGLTIWHKRKAENQLNLQDASATNSKDSF